MDAQLQEIIETIKNEGVKNAEARQQEIIDNANSKAKSIIEDAKKEAESIVSKAKEEARKHEASGKAALQQAGRDLVLTVRSEIEKLFDKVINEATGEALTGEKLGDAIVAALSNWDESKVGDLELLLPEKSRKEVEEGLKKRLSDAMKKGVEIKPVHSIQAGFRISTKDGSAYYDFSDEGIAEMLSAFVSPRLAEVLQTNGGE
ncbi:MAG: V-type ATP synthase subunit E [Alkalispirochaetaceae bacterium]